MPKSLINGGPERRPSRALDVWERPINYKPGEFTKVSSRFEVRAVEPLLLIVRTKRDEAAAGEAVAVDEHSFS